MLQPKARSGSIVRSSIPAFRAEDPGPNPGRSTTILHWKFFDFFLLEAVWEHGGCFAFLAFFRLLGVAFEPVDSDNIAFQGNPVRVIQVSMVNKFSHRSLQLLRGYFFRIYCQLTAIRGYISFET
jgi:hypothetical protein